MTTPAPTATTTNNQSVDHPVEALVSLPAAPSGAAATAEGGATDKAPASSTNKKDDESGETKAKVPVNNSSINSDEKDGASVTITQKKIRRAERFGMPVQLSEEEKRSSRAERFGTTPGSQGSDATKKAEELKRKARAERFGITQSVSTNEDEKKKARLARFASASVAADPLEEQKKKARALRFSGTQANDSAKIETKATVAGKAGGEA